MPPETFRTFPGYGSDVAKNWTGARAIMQKKRKDIVWEIERRLVENGARPVISYPVSGACWQPYFRGHTMMVNGNYKGWRFDDVWLDK